MNLTPYTDKGFACAAAGRGITEALREHLNVIVRNEELELEISDSQIQTEIDALVEDKERLEQLKLDRQENISELTEELAKKDTKLSELNANLQNPLNIDPTPSSRIEELKSELDEKKVEQGKIETDLDAPTEVELNRISVDGATAGEISKQEFSWLYLIFSIFTTITLVLLIVYIFFFYASVAAKAFTEAKSTALIDYTALYGAWGERDGFILLLPIVFVFFAIVSYFFWKENKRIFWGVVVATALFDILIAWRIAISIDLYIELEGLDEIPQSLWWLNLFGIIFLGFVVSLLLSFGLYCFMELWQRVTPPKGKSELEAKLEVKQIRAEKNDRIVQLNGLMTEIHNLETMINNLEQEQENHRKYTEETYKQRIQVKTARLNTQKEELRSRRDDLNEQVNDLQKEINSCEDQIGTLYNRKNSKGINLKKLEANKSEFVTGWCRYITQKQTELPSDIDNQIKEVHALADNMLEEYKANLTSVQGVAL